MKKEEAEESGQIALDESFHLQVNKIFERLEDDLSFNLLNKRMVIIPYDIDESMANHFMKLIYYLTKEKAPIRVIINSAGGAVYAGLLMYNTIRDIILNEKIEVLTEASGQCASIALIILQAGSCRTAYRATRFLLHEITAMDYGKVTEMEESVKELRQVNNLTRDIIAVRTGHAKEEIDKLWTKKEVWFSAEEALEFGLIDRIID